VLNALASSEHVRFKQTSERDCTDGRVPDEIRERVPDCGASNWKGQTAVSVEPVARYCKQLTVGGTQVLLSVDCRHRRLVSSSPTGTAVRSRSDTGELSLPAWKTPGRGRRASEVRHAVPDPGRGQTSECRWRHAQQRSTHAVTCPLLYLVHRKNSVAVINPWIYNGVDECSQRARVQRLPETSELTQSVVAARADARDVVIQTQITGDVDAEQTNMAAGNYNVRS